MGRTKHHKPTNKIWRTRRNIRILMNRLYSNDELKQRTQEMERDNQLKGTKQ